MVRRPYKSSLRGSADQAQGTSPETNASSSKDKGRSSRKRNLEEALLEVSELGGAETASGSLRSAARKRRGTDDDGPKSVVGGEVKSGTPTASIATSISDAKQPARPPTPTAAPARARHNSPTPPGHRAVSRRRSAAASAEPPGASVAARSLRRKSATPAGRAGTHEQSRAPSVFAPGGLGGRRRKRPAPGPVSSGQDGGAAVSYGRRKVKPTKQSGLPGQKDSSSAPNQDLRVDEDGMLEEIDPNEPRYCICGDVSFGTMICCENADVSQRRFCYIYSNG